MAIILPMVPAVAGVLRTADPLRQALVAKSRYDGPYQRSEPSVFLSWICRRDVEQTEMNLSSARAP
jgi:hypothetical protein